MSETADEARERLQPDYPDLATLAGFNYGWNRALKWEKEQREKNHE